MMHCNKLVSHVKMHSQICAQRSRDRPQIHGSPDKVVPEDR